MRVRASRHEEIRKLLLACDNPAMLYGLLGDVVRDISVRADEYREEAVYHPLGFIYVPLMRGGSWTLRLHFWTPEGKPVVETWDPYTVHMHTWDLYSYVLCGEIVNQIIEVEEAPGDGRFRVFDIVGEGRRSTITPTERTVNARVTSEQRVPAGGMYRMSNSTYHTSLNPTGVDIVTAALVVRVPGARERTLGPLDGKTHQYLRPSCPPAELASQAARVAEGLL